MTPDNRDLNRRSVRGGAITAVSQVFRVGVSTLTTAVLARLLTRDDFGLVAMVTAFSGIVAMFRDFGLSAATVQRRDLTDAQQSGLFWINAGASIVLGLLFAALAPALAWFYKDERLVMATLMVALTFPIGGLGIQHDALLRRSMRYDLLAWGTMLSQIAGLAVGVAGGIAGMGYKALVASMLAAGAMQTVLSWCFCRWRPGRSAAWNELKPLVSFGAAISATNLLAYVHRNLDNVLIGRVLGADALGLYSKAYGLVLVPLRQVQGPLGAVALSALARLQGDEKKYKDFYFRSVELVFCLTMPMVMFAVAAADEVVRVLLGPAWSDAAHVFRLLGPATLAGTTYFASSWAFQTLGHVGRQTKFTLWTTPFVVLAFVVGLRWGTKGVAIAYSVYSCLVVVPLVRTCYRDTLLRARDLWNAASLPLASSLLAGCSAWSINLAVDPLRWFVPVLAAKAAVFAAVWLATWRAVPGGWARLSKMLRAARHLKSAKGGTAESDS